MSCLCYLVFRPEASLLYKLKGFCGKFSQSVNTLMIMCERCNLKKLIHFKLFSWLPTFFSLTLCIGAPVVPTHDVIQINEEAAFFHTVLESAWARSYSCAGAVISSVHLAMGYSDSFLYPEGFVPQSKTEIFSLKAGLPWDHLPHTFKVLSLSGGFKGHFCWVRMTLTSSLDSNAAKICTGSSEEQKKPLLRMLSYSLVSADWWNRWNKRVQ